MRSIVKFFALAAICISSAFAASAQLPSVQLKDINGKPVDTATLSNDGKPFVISFWYTSCKPCLRELKAISEVYEDWQDETGMKLIAVSTDDAQKLADVKQRAANWDYEVLLDPNKDFMRAMGVQMNPHVIIIDGNGNIAGVSSGIHRGQRGTYHRTYPQTHSREVTAFAHLTSIRIRNEKAFGEIDRSRVIDGPACDCIRRRRGCPRFGTDGN